MRVPSYYYKVFYQRRPDDVTISFLHAYTTKIFFNSQIKH